ncbi:MAG: class I SAM-dependent methyltransferase [Rubripirellula sp.]|nr:class I SAM-dependent methyltransferase [Rubripirellula sp.]
MIGADLSKGMIDLAIEKEHRRPLGIEYRVQNVSELDAQHTCDLAFADWLLNYASTAQELERMCKAIARSLEKWAIRYDQYKS